MEITDWLKANEGLFGALGLLSVALFLLSLIIFPLIIVLLPHDYFVREEATFGSLNPFRMVLRLLKNIFGVVLFVAGLLMLFLPGQGLLSILLGISLINFPGKRRLEMRLLAFKRIRASVAWIRLKANRPPIILPEDAT